MRVAEGMVLGGRYRMLRTIAVGGMGEVWEGVDDALGRPVAVKALRPEFAGETNLLERFRVEARNSAALSHPNIAPLFDYGEDDGTAFLVMELVPGHPLSDILERETVLPPSRLLPILSQTARGLHYAHQMGVVHRDVKPGNILVEPSGRVRITDFGVSQAVNQTHMTATGMVMGTAQYLSPEQAVGRPATRLSDIYALGIIAYEALVGRRPFTGATPVDIAIAQVNDPVPALPHGVDARLAALVMRLLDKDPAGRPQSGDELAALFDQLVAATPTTGVPMAPAATQSPRSRMAAGRPPAPALRPTEQPPTFAPRSRADTHPPTDDAIRVGPRRPAAPPTRGARARAVPGAEPPARPVAHPPTYAPAQSPVGESAQWTADRRPGAGGSAPHSRPVNRQAPPPGPTEAPRWLRIAVIGAAAGVLLILVVLVSQLAAGALDSAPAYRPASIEAAVPIRSSLITTSFDADDCGGQHL